MDYGIILEKIAVLQVLKNLKQIRSIPLSLNWGSLESRCVCKTHKVTGPLL